MGISLIAGAGIAIAASVGPAREWRSALRFTENDAVVDRSEIVRSEGGVPGSVLPAESDCTPVIKEHVPLQELLIKPPAPADPDLKKPIPKGKGKPLRIEGTPLPVVVVRPPREPRRILAIPTNTSPAPANTTQQTGDMQVRNDGPTESAAPQRTDVTITKGSDGWNTVTTKKVGFSTTNPERAKAIDAYREAQEAPLKGKPHIVLYNGVDPRDPDSSMKPSVESAKMQVHDSQVHLFENGAQTQRRLADAQQQMLAGNSNPMQQLFRDIADSSAAAQKTRVYRGPGSYRRAGAGMNAPMYIRSGPLDPRLTENKEEEAAASELEQLTGVARYAELLNRNESERAIEYLKEYAAENKDDGRSFAVLGLQQLSVKKNEAGLKNLARACELSASTFSEPIDVASMGISQSALADVVSTLIARKEQSKGVKEAVALAAASHAIGRTEAAKNLLEQAVRQGMDRADAATLAGLWKLPK